MAATSFSVEGEKVRRFISQPPEAKGLHFGSVLFYFFLFFFFIGFMPSSGGYGGTPGIFVDRGAGHARLLYSRRHGIERLVASASLFLLF